MNKLTQNETKNLLISSQDLILKRAGEVFEKDAYEAHVFGSVARNNADPYSDLDIWFTIKDENYEKVFLSRFDFYQKLGTVIHFCEPPQNAPIGGVHTALIIKTDPGILTMVDIYLCPLSSSFITDDSVVLFGKNVPQGKIGFNPQKIQVDENYRIDFFICFIFNTIKKIIRKSDNPLDAVIYEYNNLHDKYNINLKPLKNKTQDKITLEEIIKNTYLVANKKQKDSLKGIQDFLDLILRDTELNK